MVILRVDEQWNRGDHQFLTLPTGRVSLRVDRKSIRIYSVPFPDDWIDRERTLKTLGLVSVLCHSRLNGGLYESFLRVFEKDKVFGTGTMVRRTLNRQVRKITFEGVSLKTNSLPSR